MICKTDDQRRIFDRVGERIEAEPQDGIGAEGVYSEHVHATQRAYVGCEVRIFDEDGVIMEAMCDTAAS